MNEKLRPYAPVILRLGAAAVFLWFGVSQILNPVEWTGWLPSYAGNFGIEPDNLVLFNGFFETAFGTLLFLGFYTRIAAGLLALHMAHILTVVGYGEIGVRDFALFSAALSAAFYGADFLTIDGFLKSREEKRWNI